MRTQSFAIHRKTRRGVAALEFAVIAPVLVLFIFGIIEIGRVVMVSQMATNASRETARYAAQGTADTATLTTYCTQYLSSVGISSSALSSVAIEYQTSSTSGGVTTYTWSTTTNPTTLAQGTPIRATVTLNYSAVAWLPTTFFVGSSYQIAGKSVGRKE